jgi:hypothetical protein
MNKIGRTEAFRMSRYHFSEIWKRLLRKLREKCKVVTALH